MWLRNGIQKTVMIKFEIKIQNKYLYIGLGIAGCYSCLNINYDMSMKDELVKVLKCLEEKRNESFMLGEELEINVTETEMTFQLYRMDKNCDDYIKRNLVVLNASTSNCIGPIKKLLDK